jgi:gliding motility-associated-like protein
VATADNKTKYYGYNVPVLTISYSGFKNNDDPSVLDVLPTAFTTAINTSNLGTYAIALSGGSDINYDLSLENGSLEIQKAPLIITADNKTKIFREEDPPLTITYAGFVLGQDLSVLSKLPDIEIETNANSDAGIYDIIVSGAAATNYNMIYNNGLFTVNKADQQITFDDLPDGLRMTQEIRLNATASSGLDVSFDVSDHDIGDLNSNMLIVKMDGKLTVTAKQEGDKNWNPATDVSKSIVTLPTFDNISSLFTPNNDGMNDYWYLPDLEAYGLMKVTVYNRYGQPVYYSDSYKNDWDGTWNGNPLPTGSYYYVIKSSKKGYLKGVVNIVR